MSTDAKIVWLKTYGGGCRPYAEGPMDEHPHHTDQGEPCLLPGEHPHSTCVPYPGKVHSVAVGVTKKAVRRRAMISKVSLLSSVSTASMTDDKQLALCVIPLADQTAAAETIAAYLAWLNGPHGPLPADAPPALWTAGASKELPEGMPAGYIVDLAMLKPEVRYLVFFLTEVPRKS